MKCDTNRMPTSLKRPHLIYKTPFMVELHDNTKVKITCHQLSHIKQRCNLTFLH